MSTFLLFSFGANLFTSNAWRSSSHSLFFVQSKLNKSIVSVCLQASDLKSTPIAYANVMLPARRMRLVTPSSFSTSC